MFKQAIVLPFILMLFLSILSCKSNKFAEAHTNTDKKTPHPTPITDESSIHQTDANLITPVTGSDVSYEPKALYILGDASYSYSQEITDTIILLEDGIRRLVLPNDLFSLSVMGNTVPKAVVKSIRIPSIRDLDIPPPPSLDLIPMPTSLPSDNKSSPYLIELHSKAVEAAEESNNSLQDTYNETVAQWNQYVSDEYDHIYTELAEDVSTLREAPKTQYTNIFEGLLSAHEFMKQAERHNYDRKYIILFSDLAHHTSFPEEPEWTEYLDFTDIIVIAAMVPRDRDSIEQSDDGGVYLQKINDWETWFSQRGVKEFIVLPLDNTDIDSLLYETGDTQ